VAEGASERSLRGAPGDVASDAGRVGSSGETTYAAAKGGVIAFTKSLAREVARHSINVNCVCPGPTDTPMLQTRPDKLKEAFLRAIPFKRFARPQEIADAIVFFAGPRSDYFTGGETSPSRQSATGITAVASSSILAG
jgi:2-hydroxycyclohexanecarboxyl-CoA dehydrogenase